MAFVLDQQNRALKLLPLHYATSRPYVYQWEKCEKYSVFIFSQTRNFQGKSFSCHKSTGAKQRVNKTFRTQTISPLVVSPLVVSPLKLSMVVSPLDPGRFAPFI